MLGASSNDQTVLPNAAVSLLPSSALPPNCLSSRAIPVVARERLRQLHESGRVEIQWLTTWRRELEAHNAVVTYDPQTEEGFHWVQRNDLDDDVIRRPEAS